CVTCSRTLTPT
ncbi:ABC transporter transmembrane region family protein, partial [Vibrio parahaemolyticus V-223/04]